MYHLPHYSSLNGRLLFSLSNSYLQVVSKLYISWGGEGEEGTGEL